MAYVSQELKAKLAPFIKVLCKQYGVKASLSVRTHSSLVLTIKSGRIDFIDSFNRTCALTTRDEHRPFQPVAADGNIQVNPYWYKEHFDGDALAFLMDVLPAMNIGNHDNSDSQTDYFDVGWYVDVNIGTWNKPYVVTKSE